MKDTIYISDKKLVEEYTLSLLKRRSSVLANIRRHFNGGPLLKNVDSEFEILLKINSILGIIENNFIYKEENK